MNKFIYLIGLLGFLLFSVHANGQSKIEQLETQLSTADASEKAGIYNKLSELYFSSDAKKSLDNGNKALESALETKDIGSEAKAHINIGMANDKLRKYNDAIGSFKSALAIYEKHNSTEGVAYMYIQLGATYNGMKNTTSAITYFQKAFDSYKELKNNIGMARSLMSIGDAHIKKGQTHKALARYGESVPYYKAENDNEGLAHAYNKMGATHSNFGNFPEAKKMLNKALTIAKANNMSSLHKDIARNLQIVEDNMKSTIESKSEFTKAEEAKVEEHIQELEVKSSQLEEKTSDFLDKIASLDEENQLIALLVKVKEDALKQEKLLKEKKEQELALANKENEIKDAELAASEAELATSAAEIERKNAITAGLIGGLLLLTAIAFLLFNRYQQKRKANTLLAKQNKEITEQKEEITGQKVELEKRNVQISDSIDYAKRIQSAILSSTAAIRALLPESFVLFKPKDVVSGDFYWIKEQNGNVLFAAADCTGHGVPGALMSIVSDNVLNDVTNRNKTTNPGEILKMASEEIIARLQDKETQVVEKSDGAKTTWEIKDGMDIALCSLDKSTMKLQFAGAHNPLYLIRDGELIEYSGDRLFIGNTDDSTVFKTHDIQLQSGDVIYVFSDGFPDQRGGPNNKKFYYQPFKDMFLEVHKKGMDEQQAHLDKVITDWIGNKEQIDDIIVFGIRV